MSEKRICAFIDGGASPENDVLSKAFRSIKAEGYTAIASNCEQGLPLRAMSAAYNAGLRLIAVTPHEHQSNDWSSSQREEFIRIHRLAELRFLISEKEDLYCYRQADEMLISISGAVIIAGSCPFAEALARSKALRIIYIK